MIIYIWLSYGIPSFSLVIFFLFWLRKSEFQYSFYRVLQCDMMINVLCYLNTWTSRLYHVETTLPMMVWVNNNFYFWFHIYHYFVNFFYNAQSLSVIIMSAHRLWSSKSTKGNEFWNKYYGHAYILLVVASVLLSIPNLLFGLNQPDYYDPEKGTFVVNTLEPSLSVLSNNMFIAKSIIFFTIIFVINIWTVKLIRKRFAQKSESAKVRTMMKNLTTIVFINTTVFFIVLTWPIFLSFFITFPDTYRYNIVMIASDVLSLSLPYILMGCDRNVQGTFAKLRGKGKVSANTEGSKKQNENVLNQQKTMISIH